MPEEKHNKHHESHEKKEITRKFEVSKARVWQLVSVILVIVVVFLLFNKWYNAPDAQVQQQMQGAANPFQEPQRINVDAGNSPSLGPKDAKVVVIEFSDFECPYCGAAAGTYQSLIKRFKSQDPSWEAAVPKLAELAKEGKIQFVFKHFPLTAHKQAQPAAEASECANEQGKFWDYHDALFENQEKLGTNLYTELAENLDLDINKFKECLESDRYSKKVQNDFDYGKQIGVSGTPTFFINGIKVVGAQPYKALKQIIDNELAKE